MESLPKFAIGAMLLECTCFVSMLKNAELPMSPFLRLRKVRPTPFQLLQTVDVLIMYLNENIRIAVRTTKVDK